jgi:hypothetical protein
MAWARNWSLVGLHGQSNVEGIKLWGQHSERIAEGGGGDGGGEGADWNEGSGGAGGACRENVGMPLDNGVPYMTTVGLTLSLASSHVSNQVLRSVLKSSLCSDLYRKYTGVLTFEK